MSRLLILLPMLLTACDDEQGPTPKPWNGGKPVHVPDDSNTLTLFGVASAAYLGALFASFVWQWWRNRP